MHIHHLAIRVKDFHKSKEFYENLAGLHAVEQFSANGGELAYMQNANGETMIELIGLPEGETYEGKGLFLCFATSEIEKVHQAAQEGGYQPSDIRQPEPNARYFYVYDPDGFSIQFREY